jgi:hypothetical protein
VLGDPVDIEVERRGGVGRGSFGGLGVGGRAEEGASGSAGIGGRRELPADGVDAGPLRAAQPDVDAARLQREGGRGPARGHGGVRPPQGAVGVPAEAHGGEAAGPPRGARRLLRPPQHLRDQGGGHGPRPPLRPPPRRGGGRHRACAVGVRQQGEGRHRAQPPPPRIGRHRLLLIISISVPICTTNTVLRFPSSPPVCSCYCYRLV